MDLGQIRQEVKAAPSAALAWVKGLKWFTVVLLVVGVISAVIIMYKVLRPAPAATSAARGPAVLPEATRAEAVPKLEIPGPKRMTVYDKDMLDGEIPLPPAIKNNPRVQPTATADTPAAPYGGKVVSYTNVSTGKSGLSFQAAPRPWFGFGGQTAIGGGAGITTDGGQIGAVRVRQDVLRLWGAQLSSEVEVSYKPARNEGEVRSMVWGEYRF